MAAVQVRVLGCGDAVGNGGRAHTCYYVRSAQVNFLIDCGASAVLAMKKQKINTHDIDAIIISHFHGDHYGGLVFFLLDAAVFTGRKNPLTVISPPGCKERLRQLMDLQYPGIPDIMEHFPITFLEYSGNQIIREKDLMISTYPVIHTRESLPHAVKIRVDERLIAFSGDTEWTNTLFDVAKDADLFICECSFYDITVKGHLNYQTIMTQREKLNCKRILLTHLGENALRHLNDIQLECAVDGMVIYL